MKKKKSMKKSGKTITTSEFDRAFDEGRDITQYLDLKKTKVHYPDQSLDRRTRRSTS